VRIDKSAPRIPAPSAPGAAVPAKPAAPTQTQIAAPAKDYVAAASNPFAEARAGAAADQAQMECGLSLREARRAARTERVSAAAAAGAGPSIRDRVRGLLDLFDNVGPASAKIGQAFRKMIDGKALDLPDWQEQVRQTLLGPEYPATPAAMAVENRRVGAEIAGPLAKLPPRKAQFMEQLRGLGLSDVELFRGSHTVVQDNGALYEQWKALDARPRTSSHYPGLKTQQYEIELPGLGVVLFGKDKSGQTWFQMEAHGTRLEEVVPHMWDYVQHKLSGNQNIGPLGSSPHSEKQGRELRLPYAPQPAFA
jgi:hypothetical protein